MFNSLPKSAFQVIDWTAEDYQPYFDDLLQREITADNVNAWLKNWSDLMRLSGEAFSRTYVATTLDTTDETAEARYKQFLEHVYPALIVAMNALNKKLVASGITPENFEIALQHLKTDIELFREENLPLITELGNLTFEYDKMVGAQTVTWEGEEITLTQLLPIMLRSDRSTREKAWRLAAERRQKDRAAFNELWKKLLSIRVQIAKNAGYDNYRDFRWKEMKRFDYTPQDSETFQEAIKQVVTPAAQRIYERHRQQLGYESLRPWDEEWRNGIDPLGRAPLAPYQTSEEFESKTIAIFDHVDPVLGNYFREMSDRDMLDLENRKGKAPGGYCMSYPMMRRPFIFMNGVGMHDDVQTMLHEGGHAFHVFESQDIEFAHHTEPPMEFAEVASMAMELLAAPYLTTSQGGFYSEADAARARIEHLEGMIKFWPYMAVVDSFQHWVYTHTDDAIDTDKCDAKWLELWNTFMIGVDYSGLEDYVKVGWQHKLHIFQIPFYYVEYGLAQLGSVQVWANALNDQALAVANYRKALALGGTASLPELYATAGAKFAFDAHTLGDAVRLIERVIDELHTA